MLPMVLFIDVDGTLIGDISPQVCEWEILTRFDKSKLRAFRQSLIDTLENGLLRPHIADFLMDLKKRYPQLEMFIYTASNSAWAHYLVPCIEKVTRVPFQRPLFTRNNCIVKGMEFQKSLDCVLPTVIRRLKHAYPQMTLKNMKNHVAIVDNNNVLVRNEVHRCIRCPTYNFAYYYDVIGKLELSTLMKSYSEVSHFLANYGLFPALSPKTSFSMRSFLTSYHQKLYGVVKARSRELKRSEGDTFWIVLSKVLRKMALEDLQEASIRTINRSIEKKSINDT